MKRPSDVTLDLVREQRLGFGEAVLCDSKSIEQIEAVLEQAEAAGTSLLLTRMRSDQVSELSPAYRRRLDYEELSRTAFFGWPTSTTGRGAEVAVVTAGTSDTPVACEVVRTLQFNGVTALEVYDVGVAGLWRLQERAGEIATYRVVVAIAGMDGALPTVLAGLVPGLVIAVPTSTGYGIAEGGLTAMRSLLASCAPGLVVVNIDNGYGAACAALRALASERSASGEGSLAADLGVSG
jgi:NCAIR mutase (PurE)-related protein